MKLLITQLEVGENRLAFTSSKDGWVKDLVSHLATRGYRVDGEMAVDLSLTKCEPDYYLRGALRFQVDQACSRCAESIREKVEYTFEMALVRKKLPEESHENEDLDITYFDGPEIQLRPIIEEQFVLSLPYRALCRPDCQGVCQKCGKNLNQGPCGCVQTNPVSPFQKLKQVKL